MLRVMVGIFGLSALGCGWLVWRRLRLGDLPWQETWVSLAVLLIYGAFCGLGALAWNGKASGGLGALWRGRVGWLLTIAGTGALFFAWLVVPMLGGALTGQLAARLLRMALPAG